MRLGSHLCESSLCTKLAATISRDDPRIPSEDLLVYHSSGSREYCKWMVELYQGEGSPTCFSSSSSMATWRSQCSGHRSDEQHPVQSLDSVSDESHVKPLRSLGSAARFSISVSCIPFGLYFPGDHEALQGSHSRPLVFAVEREKG